MKKLLFLLLAFTIFFSFSCKKDNDTDDNNNNSAQDELFISFDMDGQSIYQPFSFYSAFDFDDEIETWFSDFTGNGNSLDFSIETSFENVNMSSSFMEGVIGVEIPLDNCTYNDECDWSADFLFNFDEFENQEFETRNADNELPIHFVKITKVTPHKFLDNGFTVREEYFLEGEFNCKVRGGGETHLMSNGHFRLLFAMED